LISHEGVALWRLGWDALRLGNQTEGIMVTRLRQRLGLFSVPFRDRPFQIAVSEVLTSGSDWGAERILLPPRTSYVIDYVSAFVRAPVEQRVTHVFVETRLSTSGPWPVRYGFVPTRTTNRESGEDNAWIVSQETRLYADSFGRPEDEWQILVGMGRERDDGGRAEGLALLFVELSGRLTGRDVIGPGEPAPPDGPNVPISG
jgi:hypothetical protein